MTTIACLTIGSSDSSGGAGVQGDIKAFASIGCFAATVVVGVTAQNTTGVRARHGLPLELVSAQLEAVLEDLPIAGIKVGTAWSAPLIRLLGARLSGVDVPVVVDPVLVTAAGAFLSDVSEIRGALVSALFPLATVVTPNRREAELLVGAPPGAWDRRSLAAALVELGAPAAVVTADATDNGDWFYDGSTHRLLDGAYHETNCEHGAGCAHSALTTGLLAQGQPLLSAVGTARQLASNGVRDGLAHLGNGVHPVDVLGLPRLGTAVARAS
ncbi:MAG TPA: bifunctional hydroxymethylpyrimidine kinase/phosphomethylpyrimidine kinase [Actinophytocola sp.]|jgi:hydroxymethylpyrimidine/phosphomethylpyrimidine kinase|nr:bifunctional hydroxymethylpyrimidine kinase/phosphomethylpyrimidine kinase [Actinophytocola sp.]